MSKNFYNYDLLKAIPIKDVCERFGIDVKDVKGSLWCKIRDENHASCKLYPETNTFCDFGNGNKGGNTINLVQCIEQCSYEEAGEKLALAFDIEPETYSKTSPYQVYDSMFSKIGLYGDLALKNMINLDEMTVDEAQEMILKYNSLSMSQLRKEYPEEYETLLRQKAVPYVLQKQNMYYFDICTAYILAKAVYVEHPDLIPDYVEKKLQGDCDDLIKAEKILEKASYETKLIFKPQVHNVKAELERILNGKLQPEIGTIRHFNMKLQAKKLNQVLGYKAIPEKDYYSLMDQGLKDIGHAAFWKQGMVNMVFLPGDKEKIFNLIDSLGVKEPEKEMPEVIEEQDLGQGKGKDEISDETTLTSFYDYMKAQLESYLEFAKSVRDQAQASTEEKFEWRGAIEGTELILGWLEKDLTTAGFLGERLFEMPKYCMKMKNESLQSGDKDSVAYWNGMLHTAESISDICKSALMEYSIPKSEKTENNKEESWIDEATPVEVCSLSRLIAEAETEKRDTVKTQTHAVSLSDRDYR